MTARLVRAAQAVEDAREWLAACLTTRARLDAPQVREGLEHLVQSVQRYDAEILRAGGQRGQWAADLIDPDKEQR